MNNLTKSVNLEEVVKDFGFKKIDLLLYFFGILDASSEIRRINLSRKDLFKSFAAYFGLEHSISSSFFRDYLSDGFVLNPRGFNRIRNILPRYYGKRRWDKCFYFVSFDIPEGLKSKRELFRKSLKERKFGLLHDSVWVNVFDYSDELVRIMKLLDIDFSSVNLFKGDIVGTIDYREFADKIWNTKAINDLYDEFITSYGLIRDLKHSFIGQLKYLAILKKDPQLPAEFLDEGWKAHTANEIYQKLVKSFFIELYQ